MSTDQEKLVDLMKDYGYNDEMDFLRNECMGSVVPGICINTGCNATYENEPDQDRGWCQECDSQTVKSGAILAGII